MNDLLALLRPRFLSFKNGRTSASAETVGSAICYLLSSVLPSGSGFFSYSIGC